MTSRDPLALSILIATRQRPDSLREVLAHLSACNASEPYEVVVIDNAGEPPLTVTDLQTPGLRALRILREMRPGKSSALNHALDEGALGEIVAVIDDDMSPASDWIQNVLSSTRRLPQFDIFSGKSHVVWPAGVAKPPWAEEPLAQGLLFSVYDTGSCEDIEFGKGAASFASGNCYWFRRSVLDRGARYSQVWTDDAQFMLGLINRGHRGVFVPEVIIGHRIQKELVDPRKFVERARRMGRELAEFHLSMSMQKRVSVLARIRFHLRPHRALAELGAWSIAWVLSWPRAERKRLPARARALVGIEASKVRLRPLFAKVRIAEESSKTSGANRPRGSAQ